MRKKRISAFQLEGFDTKHIKRKYCVVLRGQIPVEITKEEYDKLKPGDTFNNGIVEYTYTFDEFELIP